MKTKVKRLIKSKCCNFFIGVKGFLEPKRHCLKCDKIIIEK